MTVIPIHPLSVANYEMQVVFIRHAQSANNVLHDGDKVISRAEFESLRSHDPSLSELGMRQAVQLGAGITRLFSKPLSPRMRDLLRSGKLPEKKRVHIAISPMRRTLLTSLPLLDTLIEQKAASDKIAITKVEVVPYLFEVGGCYNQQGEKFVGRPGLTKREMLEITPHVSVPDSLVNGWWESSTKETEEEFELRVAKTLEWIRRLACEGTSDVLMIITHQDFACACMRRLGSIPGMRWLYNTSLTSFTLHPIVDMDNANSAGDGTIDDVHECKVVVDWINSAEHLSDDNLS